MPHAALVGKLNGRLRASSQPACFVCGQDNPQGLQLRFETGEGGERIACWSPGANWEGFRGIVHGGIVSTVLDEAMSKAVASTGEEALTAELKVRFRRHVASGSVYSIRGWVVERTKRLTRTEASLTAADGTECAHAWGRFLTLAPGRG